MARTLLSTIMGTAKSLVDPLRTSSRLPPCTFICYCSTARHNMTATAHRSSLACRMICLFFTMIRTITGVTVTCFLGSLIHSLHPLLCKQKATRQWALQKCSSQIKVIGKQARLKISCSLNSKESSNDLRASHHDYRSQSRRSLECPAPEMADSVAGSQ